MPSARRQINVRLSEESENRLKGLVARMRAALGIEVSQSDVIQAGLVELEKRYPPDQAAAPAAPAPPPVKRPAGRKKGE
jgi:Arc/MetJ-type ribon-helix-helix transcriptional regulator